MKKDPTRLDEGSDELAASIGALRQALPSEERLSALAAALARAGAPVGEPFPASRAPPALAPLARPEPGLFARRLLTPGTLSVVAALLVGGALIGGALLLRASDTPIPPPAVTELVPFPGLPAVASAASGDETRAGAAPPESGAPPSAPRTRDGTPEPAPEATSTDAVAEAPSATPSAVAAAPRAEARSTPTANGGRSSAPRNTDTQRSGPAGSTPGSATGDGAAAALARDTTTDSEIELLKQARSALGGDPAQAFALTERCRARYPNGSFAQEREYIAIAALARLGRLNEARSRASLFRAHYRNSAYLPRLAQIVGEE